MSVSHSRLLFTFSLLFLLLRLDSQVVINELMASNAGGITDPDFGDNADWLELYNTSSGVVDISGWRLSDSEGDSVKWFFPPGTSIPPHGFLVVWTDGYDTGFHTNFKLASEGEAAALYDANGALADQVVFGEQLTDVAYGRKTDGNLPWGFFDRPTPGSSNNTSTFYQDYVRQVPVFSLQGGFYDGPQTIEIKDLYQAGTIRYTLTGAAPTVSSPSFDQPVLISTTTVVKARMFYPGQLPGPVVTNTYFIDEAFDTRGLAVLSLSSDPAYFFSPDSGLYVQDFKPPWEYPVHLEFYEPDGLPGFHHDAGVAVGGENSWILPQKLLNIYSRKKYGSGHFDYQLFPNNPRTRFGDIILRTSGNDWSNTLFRDGMMQGLIDAQSDLDNQDFRPCAVYINGQYFGIHNIREKQDADYTEYYHHIPPDKLDYIENNAEVKEGNDTAYQQLVALLTNGVSGDANYQELASIVDIRDFTDYILSEIFVANTSWGHNIALFRERKDGAKWRWLLHDYDRGFNLGNVNNTGMTWATATNGTEGSNGPWATLFLRKMLENESFKQQFISRFADHLYITFNPYTINQRVNRHADWIRNEIPYHVGRWAGTTSSYGDGIPSVTFWENEVAKLKQFGVARNRYMWDDLNTFFNLQGTSILRLQVSDVKKGDIRFQDMVVPAYPWTGSYFQSRSFSLAAEARQGFQFNHWEKRVGEQTVLLPAGSTWKFSDATSAPPADWNQPGYDDAAWSTGPAQLGYGDGDEATTLSFGNNANNKTPSYYFRAQFTITDPATFSGLLARLVVDDGAVVYLNGHEIWRVNLPASPAVIAFGTLALSAVTGSGESAWNEWSFPANFLVPGQNTLAVEVHQSDAGSSDISFDFELQATRQGASQFFSSDPVITYTLGAEPTTLVAIFEPDGTCGILPDTVAQDLLLTADCSPYIADGDVTVLPNITLTAEPGVEIRFPKGASMFVNGNLQLTGTEDQPVLISNAEDQVPWGGIYLSNTTALSRLSYVKLALASAGSHRLYFPAAISAFHADMHLDHLDLTEVTDNPIFARYSNVELTDSKLYSTVTGDGINVKQGYARVENCEFRGGNQPDMDAIDYDGVSGGIVRHNVIHDFRGDNCDGLDIGEQCSNLLIEDNFIFFCYDKGISVGQQSTATIRDNVIACTGIGMALKDQSHATVDHCTFFGNQQGISAYEKNAGYLGGSGDITNCIVSNAAIDAYVADPYSGLSVTNCLSDLDSVSSPGTWNLDPKFINPTWFDFHLHPGSPAIGLGSGGSDLGTRLFPGYQVQPQVLISEILYDGDLAASGEFVELYNPGSLPVDLSGYRIGAGIEFIFPTGASIAPGGTVIVAKSASSIPPGNYPVYEWTDGKLRNEGEVIYLFDANGILVDFVRYNNHTPWPEADALLGRSIEWIAPSLDNHFATSWKASDSPGGTPGDIGNASGTENVPYRILQLTVYPNPAKAGIYLELKSESGISLTLQISSVLGQVILDRDLKLADNLHEEYIPLPNNPPGTYFISIRDSLGRLLQSSLFLQL